MTDVGREHGRAREQALDLCNRDAVLLALGAVAFVPIEAGNAIY
ncbi:MAG: hypothetical protein WD626_01260 [Bauldia sp.]